MMAHKVALKAFAVAFLSMSVQARTCTWTGGGDGVCWSDDANWDGARPENGDSLVFNFGSTRVSLTNDIAGLSVSKISLLGENATPKHSLGGEPLTIAPPGGSSNSTVAWTNGCQVKVEFGLVVNGNCRFHLGASANEFYGPVVLEGATDWRLTGRGGSTSYFHGSIYGPEATMRVEIGASGGNAEYAYFRGKTTLKKLYSSSSSIPVVTSFSHAGNEIENVVFTGSALVGWSEQVFAENTVIQLGRNTYQWPDLTFMGFKSGTEQIANRLGDGYNGDKSVTKIGVCTSESGTHSDAAAAAKLTLKGTADALTYLTLVNSLSLVWDPVGDFVQEFRDRDSSTYGTLTVKGGTMRLSGSGTFRNSPKLEVFEGAQFDLASDDSAPVRPLNALKELTLLSNARFTATNRASAFIADGEAVLSVASSAVIKLADGIVQPVKHLWVDGLPMEAGDYTGNGSSGVRVPWIEGAGRITVVSTATAQGNIWTGAKSDDFNDAENWTQGVPVSGLAGVVSKWGDTSVCIASAPGAATGSLSLENPSGSTVLKVQAPVEIVSEEVKVGGNSEILVADGGSLALDNTPLTIDGSLQIGSGLCEISYGNGSLGKITLGKSGLLKMTGGVFRYDYFGQFLQNGGTIDLSGDAVMESSMHTANQDDGWRILKSVSLKMRGNSRFSNTSQTSQGGWNFSPDAGELCSIDISDNAVIDVFSKSTAALYLGTVAGGKTVWKMDGSSSADLPHRVFIGRRNGGYGELDISGNASFRQENYAYGIRVGSNGSGSSPATGVVKISGGCMMAACNDKSTMSVYGLIVGDGLNEDSSSPIAKGSLQISGGAVTNALNGFFVLGLRSAEGEVEQSGGEMCHSGSMPMVIGFSGGKGSYRMSGGKMLCEKSNVYVGGAQTNQVGAYLGGWEHRPGDGELKVEGGVFEAGKSLYAGAGGAGAVIVGADGLIKVADDICFTNSVYGTPGKAYGAKLKFVLGANGCGKIVVGGTCRIAAGAQLEIDAADYVGKGRLTLLSCAELDGRFAPENVKISSPDGVEYKLRHTAAGLGLSKVCGMTVLVR